MAPGGGGGGGGAFGGDGRGREGYPCQQAVKDQSGKQCLERRQYLSIRLISQRIFNQAYDAVVAALHSMATTQRRDGVLTQVAANT